MRDVYLIRKFISWHVNKLFYLLYFKYIGRVDFLNVFDFIKPVGSAARPGRVSSYKQKDFNIMESLLTINVVVDFVDINVILYRLLLLINIQYASHFFQYLCQG